jgi:hypothetical protein
MFMSRISAILERSEKLASEQSFRSGGPIREPAEEPGVYAELIRRLFDVPSAIAIVGAMSSGSFGGPGICESIATQVADSSKRVALVPVDRLLRMNAVPIPDDTSFMPGRAPGVWIWPSPVGQQIEFFKPRMRADPGDWLDCLRRNFDSVLLDCPAIDSVPEAVEVAAMADATVLAVEAGRTTKQQIMNTQNALRSRGARQAGCILIRQR